MTINSHRYASALQYALTAHSAQRRKGSSMPYITHPVAVSAILAQYGFDEDLVVAATKTAQDQAAPGLGF